MMVISSVQTPQETENILINSPNEIYYQNNLPQPASINKIAEYVTRDPIAILNDTAFGPTGYNFSGSGTFSDPYQITGYNITDSSEDLIYIKDTTMYFSINNCYLNSTNSTHYAIHLENVLYGTIESNTICDTRYSGIFVDSSNNNILANNIIYNCSYGISLANSANYNNITKNSLYNNREYSVYLDSTSDNNRITWNSFFDRTTQAHDDGSNNIFVYNYWDTHFQPDIDVDGFVDSPYLVEGKLVANNGGLSLNGTIYSHLNVSPVGEFATNNITVEMWVKFRNIDDTPGLFSYGTSTSDNEFLIYYNNGIQIWIGGSYRNTNCLLSENVWTHLVVTWNSTDGETTLWKDGTLKYNTTFQAGYILETGGSLVLGQDQDLPLPGFHPTQAFDGIIDEVRVLNQVLDQSEIQADFNAYGQYPSRTDTIGWYHLNDSGVTATDSAGGIGDATVNSSEWTDGVQVGNFDPHPRVAPIWINENSDFEGFALTGNGTENDPYLLEGYYFTPKKNDIISIYNTTAYFRISNSILRSLSLSDGIILSNVTHGIIENNTFYDCWTAIYLMDSNNNALSNNTLYNGNFGMWLERSNNSYLTGNAFYDCNWYGINLLESNNNTLIGNTFYNSGTSIYLEFSSDNVVSTNTIFDCPNEAIYLDFSPNNLISGNTCNNSYDAIVVYDSSNITLTGNTIYDSESYGIAVDSSYNSTITNNIIGGGVDEGAAIFLSNNYNITILGNTIYENSETGIYMLSSDNTTIRYNTFFNNTNYGLRIQSSGSEDNRVNWNNFVDNNEASGLNQSYDEGTTNNISYNYWDDHTSPDTSPPDGIVDTPYNLEGTANNKDYYPLITPILPTVAIDSPLEQTYGIDTITVQLSGRLSIQYQYYIEGEDSQNHTWTTSVDRTLTDGSYILHVYGRDVLGHTVHESVTFAIDTTVPTIILTSPTNATVQPSGTTIDVAVTDTHLHTVLYHWDGATNQTWSGEYETSLPTGETQHVLRVYANDSVDNWASEEYVFTTDDTAPTIELDSPENYTRHLAGTSINLTVTDLHLETVLYNWDNATNQTLPAPYSIILPTDVGQHVLKVYAKDSAGHWTVKTYIFMTRRAMNLGPLIIVGAIGTGIAALVAGNYYLQTKGLSLLELLGRKPPRPPED
jgi:parallel beta-helix repeat protein